MVLASKLHSIPVKFISKEGKNSTLRAAIFESYLAPWSLVHDVKLFNKTSGRVTWALKQRAPCRTYKGPGAPMHLGKLSPNTVSKDGKFKMRKALCKANVTRTLANKLSIPFWINEYIVDLKVIFPYNDTNILCSLRVLRFKRIYFFATQRSWKPAWITRKREGIKGKGRDTK